VAPDPIASEPVAAVEVEAPAAVVAPEVAAPEVVPVPVTLPVAEPAPLAVTPQPAAVAQPPAAASQQELLGLPLKLLNELLRKLGATPLQSLADALPLLRILALAVVAGIALKLTSATLGAIDDIPLVGGLLELVGLVSLLNFMARNAFKQQKRAELLARIQQIKTDLLG
jgi:hypothetical protein